MRYFIYSVILMLLAACNGNNTGESSSKANTTDTTIAEKTFIELGGEKQYVEITGASSNNPVLLFIHGGPGWPQTPQLRYFNADLNKSFVVVAWDQAGCGQSYINNPNPKSLSLEQIVKDAHQLTQVLKKKFNKSKIYLVGYSWGSVVGLHLAQQYPDDYFSYTGVAQVINMIESISVSRKWVEERAKENNDTASLTILKKLAANDKEFCSGDLDCFIKQHALVDKYHGAVYDSSAAIAEEKSMTFYADYKNYDWLKGFEFSATHLEKDMFATNFSNLAHLDIPVFFFEGRHDWNVPSVIVEQFIKNLSAPKKEIVWFENAGHGLLYEEAGKFNKTLAEKLLQ